MSQEPLYLSPRKACELLDVDRSTLLRWESAGLLAAHRFKSGHRRYLRADLLAMLPEQVSP